jgi:hypothetical protein
MLRVGWVASPPTRIEILMRRCHLFVCLNAFCLALLSAGPAFAQNSEAISEKTSSASVAYVYVHTGNGVNLYDANTAGELTLVKGSPFAISGLMSADNGKYLVSVGTDNIHTYKIESNGAVGKQASEIDTQKYSGAKCGTNSGAALLDHTGKYLYLTLWSGTDGNPFPLCAAVQTYKLESSGELTFLGDTENFDGQHQGAYPIGVSTVSSNDKFGYGVESTVYASIFAAFKADANGALLLDGSFSQVGPTPDPSVPDSNYFPLAMAADPASHLAVLMNEPFTYSPPPQLASFTINDTTGAIVSTNTWANMPTPQVNPGLLEMSPSGKLLVVIGQFGIQIFHFNGAAPITAYSGALLPNVSVDQVAWDNNNHLYVLSNSTGELYVFTVTPTSINEVSGSPYNIPGLTGMIVVPK